MGADRRQRSFPQLTYPPQRDTGLKNAAQWLRDKRTMDRVDRAQSLWRVHDALYDLTEFASHHPGGADWIRLTRGTDITEAFESHHVSERAETLLPRYRVGAAASPRHSPFTFHPDGFYAQLKRAARAELARADPRELRAATLRSAAVTDAALACTLLLATGGAWLTRRGWWTAVPALATAAVALSALATCAHNYLHGRDAWRMRLMGLAGLSWREWRVSHAMAHHLYTNTALDLELSQLEPFLCYLPDPRKPLRARLATLYFPLVFSFVSIGTLLKGWMGALVERQGEAEEVLVPLVLPLMMWAAAGSAPRALLAWVLLLALSGFIFAFFGLTAGHHDNTNFFEGDVPRSESVDWGEHQLSAVVEREEYRGRPALALMRFGEHALHHLFPTLDHALLPRLAPVLARVARQHDLVLRTTTGARALVAQSRQLARRLPHDFSAKPPRLSRF